MGLFKSFFSFKHIKASFSLISLAALLAISCGALLVHAQEETSLPADREIITEERQAAVEERRATNTAAREQKREEMQTTMENRMASRTAAMEERRAQLTVRMQERITNLAANISNRMEAAIVRIQQIINRLESRVEKLAATGVDTTEAEEHLLVANISVDATLEIIADIDTQVAAVVGSENPREAWQTARDTFAEAKTELKNAHTALRDAVADLKEAVRATEGGQGVGDAVRNNATVSSSDTDEIGEETEEDTSTTTES